MKSPTPAPSINGRKPDAPIRPGEKGYIFFAEQEYTRDDGTKATGYTITKAYDISQNQRAAALLPQQHLPEEIIAAMIEQSPVPLAISDQLPQGGAGAVCTETAPFLRNG